MCLDSLWNHLVGTIMPIAAVLALVGAILNFATRKPFMRLVAVALALLCVSGIWKLVLAMMVGMRMNLSQMTFDHGILHLANWVGNVIMPTIAAAFIIMAIMQFSKGKEFSHSMYGALACLMVSGLTRAFETFASQRHGTIPTCTGWRSGR